jgi:hypothetical protein
LEADALQPKLVRYSPAQETRQAIGLHLKKQAMASGPNREPAQLNKPLPMKMEANHTARD